MNQFFVKLIAMLCLAGLGHGCRAQSTTSTRGVISADVELQPATYEAVSSAAVGAIPQKGVALRAPDMAWVESTLVSMSLEEKIGQMIMPQCLPSSAAQLVRDYHVGGFIFNGNDNLSADILKQTNSLQAITSVPLLFALDCEAGAGSRLADGTKFPMAMAVAATGNTDYAEEQGRITARECRAVGIQLGLGPILDVNTEPSNLVIGIRSFSDNPKLVTNMARAYVKGATGEGLLCTFKNFPGHGPTSGDSHDLLPVVKLDAATLDETHVSPFQALIKEGLGDLVMTAHVWYPALDPGTKAWPATLSKPALDGILRKKLGFDGAIISDAYRMAGLQAAAKTYDATRIGVLAGVDIVLTPEPEGDAMRGLLDAVQRNEVPLSRIDDAVRRILKLKSRVGMPEVTTNSTDAMAALMRHPEHVEAARKPAVNCIVTARIDSGDFPLTATQKVLCLSLEGAGTIFYRFSTQYFTDSLRETVPGAEVQLVGLSVTPAEIQKIAAQAAGYDRIIVISNEKRPTFPAEQVSLVQEILKLGKPTAYVCFGNPYQVLQFPAIRNLYCAFSSHFASQQEMARVITGLAAAKGKWPVSIPGVFADP